MSQLVNLGNSGRVMIFEEGSGRWGFEALLFRGFNERQFFGGTSDPKVITKQDLEQCALEFADDCFRLWPAQ